MKVIFKVPAKMRHIRIVYAGYGNYLSTNEGESSWVGPPRNEVRVWVTRNTPDESNARFELIELEHEETPTPVTFDFRWACPTRGLENGIFDEFIFMAARRGKDVPIMSIG